MTVIATEAEKPASKSVSHKAARILLSLFICFHLIVIVVLANGSSFLGRSLEPGITPYGNVLGLNITWTFFAPDPAHTMFIRYIIYFDDESGNELQAPLEGYIPEEKDQIVVDTSKRRFLYAMRFLILDQKRMKALLGPFLCRQHPGASSISLEEILEPIPNLDQSRFGEMKSVEETKMLTHNHRCNDLNDEVEL
jgi:hypothetical protein